LGTLQQGFGNRGHWAEQNFHIIKQGEGKKKRGGGGEEEEEEEGGGGEEEEEKARLSQC
jgi:hypothetical protein